MPPKKRSSKATYSYKLRVLRQLVDRFDAQRFDKILQSKPRTASGRKARAATLRQVSSAYTRVRPFVHRPHKMVRVKNKKHLEELRKYVGLNKFKGLRAVPVPGFNAKKIRVKFDKKSRVTVKEGNYSSVKLFRFPRVARNGEEAIEMLEDMMKQLPEGNYFIMTRHHMMIRSHYDKGSLLAALRKFTFGYAASAVPHLGGVYGVKWMTGSDRRVREMRKAMQSERGMARLERQRIKNEKAARDIARQNKRLSKRARATGRR